MTTAQGSGRLSALRTGRLYPQEILLVPISVRGWVDPRPIVRSEWFYVTEKPLTPAGVEPAIFRFVAQHLNHCATAVPFRKTYNLKWCYVTLRFLRAWILKNCLFPQGTFSTHILTHIITYIIFRTIHFMSHFGQIIPGVSLRYNHTVSSKLNFTYNKTKTFLHYWWRTQFRPISQLVTATKRSPNSSTYNEGLSESWVGLHAMLN